MKKQLILLCALLAFVILASCSLGGTPAPVDPAGATPDIAPAPDAPSAEPTPTPPAEPVPVPAPEPDPTVLKYYQYFAENHSLTDNIIFTVDDNTLQDEVIYFAFMNTAPIDGNPDDVRTKEQVDGVLDKYFGIKPKRYNTGTSGLTEDGKVQMFSRGADVFTHHRLLLKTLTDNKDGSVSALFKLYKINAYQAPDNFDQRILSGDPEMETYYVMDVDTVFTEIPEGDSYYLRFSKFSLIPREGDFAPPPQETDYSKKVSPEELVSYHGLWIGMTLDEAKPLLKIPENAYMFYPNDYADYTLIDADGWHYTFRTRPKAETSDKTQYLASMSIREYQGPLFRDIALGDAYKDVIKKFPLASEEGQTLGAPDCYATRDYPFANTLRAVDVFTGGVHFSMTFGRYNTLAWADIYAIGD